MIMRTKVGPGGLALLLVLTLMALGIGIALWSKVLTIEGVVRTGTLNDEFVRVFTDDDDFVDDDTKDANDSPFLSGPPIPPGATCPTHVGQDKSPLGNDKDLDDGFTSCDPAATGRDPKPRYDKDVARCDALKVPETEDPEPQPGSQTAIVALTNVYPSYHCTAWFDIHNNGTIPELLHSVRAEGVDVAPCLPGLAPTPFDLNGDGAPDIEICVSELPCTADASGNFKCDEPQIDPSHEFQFNLDIHVVQTAPQGATLSFAVEVCKHQWNEETGNCPEPTPPPPPAEADFGDAPSISLPEPVEVCSGPPGNYPSLLADGGPFHTDFTDVWVGAQPNTETAEPDAIVPNCDDWIAPAFDVDDGCIAMFIGGPASGWACVPGDGGGVFGPYPGGAADSSCELALWAILVSVGAGAPAVPRFANVVVDDRCPGPDGFYGEVPAEHVLVDSPVVALPEGTEVKFTGFFFSEVFCDDFKVPPPPAPPLTDCTPLSGDNDGDGRTDEWGVLPHWNRFMVSRTSVGAGWDGSGPVSAEGETEDWLVVGDPDKRFQGQPPQPPGIPEFPREQPDLVVQFQDVTLISATNECLVRYVVGNIGAGPAGPSFTHVEIVGSPPEQEPTPALAPGGSVAMATAVPALDLLGCSGQGRLVADTTTVVAESNEGNNADLFP